MILVAAGICIQNGRVLLSQRPPGKHLAGVWEFPGGKIEAGETPEAALQREFQEELAVSISNINPYTFAHHRYPEQEVLLLFFTCDIDGSPESRENNPFQWVLLAELDQFKFPDADLRLVAQLKRFEP